MTDVDTEFIAMQQLKQVMTEELGPYKTRMQELEAKMREIMDPYVEKIQAHEENIRNAVLMQEKSYKGDFGKDTFKKGYPRYTWDNKAMEGYVAAGHEELLQFRKKTFVKLSVTIEVL
ncbi:MAG: hypothetical protein Q8J68_09385 [Methanolobus sp.]|uniref:hypothetical protein n=1 Tax=Methanolobus sp. TaxID=1874737 RepID=UPI002731BF77|nr:hypothetical protein [Methanolobus sp.]MDP2217485.1 hypothetical protein [Methanolobus sp.]